MLKLIKYELIGRYKSGLALLLSYIVLNALLFTNIFVLFGASIETSTTIGQVLSMFLSIAILVIAFIRAIRLMSKELFSDSGYLTFTLPFGASKILGAKIVVFVLEGLVFLLAVAGVSFYSIATASSPKVFELIKLGINNYASYIFYAFIYALITYICFMLLIYLSITLSKSILVNRKHGKLFAALIFIVLNNLQNFIYYLAAVKQRLVLIDTGYEAVTISLIITIAFGVAYFMGTKYLLDNKINI